MYIILQVGFLFLRLIYALLKLLPIQNKVVMISRQEDEPSLDFRLIQERLMKENKNIKIVMLCKRVPKGIFGKFKYLFHMLVQMYHLATSKVAVLDTYCIVVSVLTHKPQLKVIQMWHSIGTMKKFGYTVVDKQEGNSKRIVDAFKMHFNYDYILASSDAYKKDLASGFGYQPEDVTIIPLPRVDCLKNEDFKKEKINCIMEAYPELNTKKNILYCPTFRKDDSAQQLAINQLINAVDYKTYNLIIKMHPLSNIVIDDDKAINDTKFTTFDMLFVADYVISDYSCIIYEAALLSLPLYFYNFDMNIYEESRGLAIDYYKEMPGLITGDVDEIVKSIESDDYSLEEITLFANKYVKQFDDNTGLLVDLILSLL